MKKSIIVLFVLIFLTVSTAFAYDIEWTLVGNIPFGARTYECVNNVCEQPSMNFVQEKQGSAVQLNFQGSATQANPDYYALYLWPQDMCHVPTAFHIELYGSATWTSNVNFFKKPSTECGSNVENIQATATEVQVGETVIVTADLESMFYPADNLVTYIPSDLVDYYDSIVDVFFTVNGISVDQDQFNIGYEEHWKQVSYDFTPTQPGTYVLRIASKMDNDCKCNQPSNYKYREVIVEVPEPPTYCGDEEVQQPNDDGLFEYCDNDAEGPGVQCLEECRMDALWDDDECSCCGDAVVNGDETCDPNDPTGPTNCRTTGDVCTYCGDSIIQTGEECDDGNDVNDDFCSNECTTNECRLNLTKVDDPDPVEPGELLNYKINITNVGEKACDGAGYEIIEYYDLYTDFFGAEPWPSFSDFIWLFMNLDLGESQLVDINVTVSETVECGQVLYNEVCTYVYETDIETCIIENTTVVCPPGCLEGYKRDSVNIGLPGWNITVQNILNPNLSYSTITDGTGHYKFDNLPVGQWTVREETQSGWELLPGYSDIYLVNVTQEQECTQRDFFNQQVSEIGCVNGLKRDDNHTGLQGWTIHAQKNPSGSVYTTTTNENGTFSFTGLQTGVYEFWEEMQPGWEAVTAPRFNATVISGQECIFVAFKNKPLGPYCGDNNVDFGEDCDDGANGIDTDGCFDNCTFTYCGDDIIQTPNGFGLNETCDDGVLNGLPNQCNEECSGTTDPFCGNNVTEPGEDCDDGANGISTDGCFDNCTFTYCGDGVIQVPNGFGENETCDDGALNGLPNQCNEECSGTTDPFCGNNVVEAGEDCDDGANGVDTDGCFDNCTFTYCGDDIIQVPNGFGENETCDDGVLNGQPLMCNLNCSGTTDPFCGNNVTEPGEDCDDGANGISTDGCFDNCTFTYCGDGVIQVPNGFGLNETCDDGILNGLPNQCNEECTGTTPPFCGNNITEAGEDCDDGSNGIDTDGCFDDCTLTYCGDNIIQTPNGFGQNEECDDGNNIDDDGCSAICEIEPYCGDGNLDPGEECEFDYHCIDGDPSTIDTCSNCECDNTVLYGCLEGYKRDSVEVGLPGWNITATNIYNSNLTYSILTDGTGHYIFNSLPIGEWSVREEMQEYWEVLPGYSDIYLVNVTEGETCTQQDFFNQQVSRIGCVEGLKRDENHTGLEGWVIHAQKINETLVYTTVSNENGTFSFTGLEAGLYEFWEDMKPDWEAVTLPRFNATVIAGEECIQIAFKNRETCIDECQLGRYCVNNSIYECGDYDEDSCLELREEENCDYYNETEAYYECQLDYSHGYRNITEGFCNNYPEPFCDFNTYSENVSDEYCGVTECNSWEYCEDNDVYSGEECTFRGCEIITGLCFENNSTNTTLIEDCGENETSTEVCYFQNLTYTLTEYFCVEDNDNAFCDSGFEEVVVEDCGPDICVEYTDMNIFVKEYVHDEETCENDECVPDPGDFYDYCITESLLNQSLCLGNDYSYEEFDCDSLDQCYEFVCEECVCCSNPYDGLCEEVTCQKIGMRFIDYYCEDGACGYNDQEEMIDVDGDMIDDRCDDCMDVDQDGTCDDVDNCVGVYNPTQVDEDRDGYGNACDNDRDGDGYPANEDCDDWNAEVNPGVEEIKNNGRDDDCNPDTEDKGEYTARQALHVDAQYDESLIEPGKGFTIVVTATNQHEKRLDDLQLMVSIPGFQEKQAKLVRELGSGNSKSRSFTIEMPRNFNSEYEELRVSVSNDKYRRTVYRELKLPK